MPSSLTENQPLASGDFSLPTCVGLRYGRLVSSLEAISRQYGLDRVGVSRHLPLAARRSRFQGFASGIRLPASTPQLHRDARPTPLDAPSLKRPRSGTGMLTRCPSPTPVRPRLRPAYPHADDQCVGPLGLPARRTLTSVSLLMPAFALVRAPTALPSSLRRCARRSPTTDDPIGSPIRSFGGLLEPR